MNLPSLLPILATAVLLGASALPAQVPQLLNYQGRVISNGTNFTGNGQFKFALVNAAGAVTYWSNDGTSVAGSQPAAAATLVVSSGLYSVLLGDTSLAGMTAIPATVFTNSDVRLRVWFNDGVTGSQLLTPDQRIAAVGYAMMGANVPDGAITTAKLADGAITAAKIADGTIATADLAPNSVNTSHIIDGQVQTADLADSAVNSAKIADLNVGTAELANNAVNSAKVQDASLLGADLAPNTVTSVQLADSLALGNSVTGGQLDIFRNGVGTESIRLFGGASQISTYGDDGLEQIRLWGPSWGEMYLYDSTANNNTAVKLTANDASGGRLELYRGGTNQLGATLSAGTTTGGRELLYTAGNQTGVDIRAQFSGGAPGAWMALYHTNQERITFAAQNGDSGRGGRIDVKNNSSLNTFRITGDTGGNSSRLEMYSGGTNRSFRVEANDSAGGSALYLYNGAGSERVEIDSDDGDNGAIIRLRNSAGLTTITLDADLTGDGRITTQELQITGGSDLSEQFDITAPELAIQPGMVVCIDPQNPGQLILSSRGHDRTVAGIISGAGGVKPGMLMGQRGTAADGKHPVALTGRVYCWVDASQGAIQPGDLITTSETPGHAMKVTNPGQSQGAILGKAMTSLTNGKGLVLVLVSLQ